jgi:GDSL-like Lipase/Acylhydrolase family
VAAPAGGGFTAGAVSNGRVDARIGGDGRVTIGAAGGNGFSLLYGWPGPHTSYTTVRADGQVFVVGTDGTPSAATAPADLPPAGQPVSQGSWVAGDLTITQTVTIADSVATGGPDAVKETYRVTNNGSGPHVVDVRSLQDTDVAGNDGALFRLRGRGLINHEEDLTGADIPYGIEVYKDIADPAHVAAAGFADAQSTRPDRVVFGYWPQLFAAHYDYAPDPARSLSPDSAYALYWTGRRLAPGASTVVSTTYGLGRVVADLRPPLGLGADAARVLTVAETGPHGRYQPLTVTITVRNTSTQPVAAGTVHLQLPARVTAAPGTDLGFPPLAPGAEVVRTVDLTVAGRAASTELAIGITATAPDVPDKSITLPVTAPAIPGLPLGLHYVALGDSYSAGEGLENTGLSDANSAGCDRAKGSYSHLVHLPGSATTMAAAAAVDHNDPVSFTFGACSGAEIDNFANTQQHQGEPLQQAYLQPRPGSLQGPGSPSLVTLTLGGNDAGFKHLAEFCFLNASVGEIAGVVADCTGVSVQVSVPFLGTTYVRHSLGLIEAEDALIDSLRPGLARVYEQVHVKAPDAAVLVLGYPQIFPHAYEPACWQGLGVGVDVHGVGLNVGWDTPVRDFLREAVDRTDGVIGHAVDEAAASTGGVVHYLDPRTAFAGHELCGPAGSWFFGPWESVLRWNTKGTLHPKSEGHQAYARLIDTAMAQPNVLAASYDAAAGPGVAVAPPPELALAAGDAADTASAVAAVPAALVRPAAATPAPLPGGPQDQQAPLSWAEMTSTVLAADGSVCPTQARPGSQVRLEGTGFLPGAGVQVQFRDPPVAVDDVATTPGAVAGPDGTIRLTAVVPANAVRSDLAGFIVKGLSADGSIHLGTATFPIDPTTGCPAAAPGARLAPPAAAAAAPASAGRRGLAWLWLAPAGLLALAGVLFVLAGRRNRSRPRTGRASRPTRDSWA